MTSTNLQLRSLVKNTGELELSLAQVPIGEPGPDEVLVRIEASPLKPSDLGLLLGAADVDTIKVSGTPASPVVTAKIPARMMRTILVIGIVHDLGFHSEAHGGAGLGIVPGKSG